MRNTVLAACVAAVFFLPAAALAQTDAPVATIERARQLFAEGRPSDALAILRQVPQSADTAKLRIDIAVSLDDFREAIAAFDDLSGRVKSAPMELLRSIATRRAAALRKHPDPEVRVEACETLMAVGAAADCGAELLATANDSAAGMENRLHAARVLTEHKARGAAALLEAVIQQGIANSPVATASALEQMPPSLSNEPLIRLLVADNRDAEYLAAVAITRRRVPEAVAALRSVANDPEAGAARLMAYIGLAALRQPDGLRVLRETLPLIKGRDRLEAARALIALKDPEGPAILASLLTSESDMLRIEVAELLYSSRPRDAGAALSAGIESTNQWIRAAAIAAARRVGMPLRPSVRTAVGDDSPRVALAAIRSVLTDSHARQ